MLRGLLLLPFAIFIDLLQAGVSVSLMVLTAVPGPVILGLSGCLVGGKIAGDIGCSVVGAVGALAGAIPFVNGFLAAGTEPLGTILGFVFSICISITLGTALVWLLALCGMFYPRLIIGAYAGEVIPGISILPAWTTLVILSMLKKKVKKVGGPMSVAARVASSFTQPQNDIGNSARAGTAQGMTIAANTVPRFLRQGREDVPNIKEALERVPLNLKTPSINRDVAPHYHEKTA